MLCGMCAMLCDIGHTCCILLRGKLFKHIIKILLLLIIIQYKDFNEIFYYNM